jgi:hypothetical protein
MALSRDIWMVARVAVRDPKLSTRLSHSSVATEFKRAKKWSTLGKIAKKAVNIASSFIPVPIVGSIVDMAADEIQSRATSASHQKKGKKYAGNARKTAKFGWKEIGSTVSDMDRYRYKIEDSSSVLRKMSLDATEILAGASEDSQVCHGAFEIAQATEYVISRCDKMDQKMAEIEELITATKKWTADTREAAETYRIRVSPEITKFMEAGHASDHDKCKSDRCAFNATAWRGASDIAKKTAPFANYIAGNLLSPSNMIDRGMEFTP